jgi:hypothetical protein
LVLRVADADAEGAATARTGTKSILVHVRAWSLEW